MKLEFETYGAYCGMETFVINDVKAREEDFGESSDEAPDDAEDYGCGDRRFRRDPATPAVLEKYGITQDEYDEICDKLEEELSFGKCGWCV